MKTTSEKQFFLLSFSNQTKILHIHVHVQRFLFINNDIDIILHNRTFLVDILWNYLRIK